MRFNVLTASRKGDAIISVCQNNDKQSLEIVGINRAAEQLLGKYHNELKGHSLYEVVGGNTRDRILNFLDFIEQTNDLSTVLNKLRRIEVVNKDGNEIAVQVKAFCSLSKGKSPIFELLIRDISLQDKIEDMKKQLQANRDNPYMVEESGLMSNNSFIKCMNLVIDFISQHPIDACCAVIGIMNYRNINSNYGEHTGKDVVSEIIKIYSSCTREEDIIGYTENGRMAIILFNCSYQEAGPVITRIKTKISQPIKLGSRIIEPDINISYTAIKKGDNANDLIDSCNKSLSN